MLIGDVNDKSAAEKAASQSGNPPSILEGHKKLDGMLRQPRYFCGRTTAGHSYRDNVIR
jgi:hypothetical protein